MGSLIDLTGKKFGRLVVIKKMPNKGEYVMWLCKCSCGVEKIIRAASLRSGNTKSCGCLNKEIVSNKRRLSLGLGNMRSLIIGYKRHAKKRGIEYEITQEQFTKITQKDCYYCGAKPNNKAKGKGHFGEYIYNGIDRIDNNKGYTIDNIVPCCKDCNWAKHKQTITKFENWVERIYNKMLLRKMGEIN